MKYIIGIITLLWVCAVSAAAQPLADTGSRPVVWQQLAEEDILWHKTVWRRMDVYVPPNAPLRWHAASAMPNTLPQIVADLLHSGRLTAYANDSCTIPLSGHMADSLMLCNAAELPPVARQYLHYRQRHTADNTDTVPDRNHLTDTAAISDCTWPQQVVSYFIMEEWIFDRNQGKMIVRISAIAPEVMRQGNPQPLWWVRYNDIRPALAQHNIYTRDNKHASVSWSDWFENRDFSSLITRVAPEIRNNNISYEPKDTQKKKKRKHRRDTEKWEY